MMKQIFATLLCSILLIPALADEGMWIPMLLKKYNEADMQAKGMKLSAEDIYSINQSSLKDAIVLFGGGCTAEIVSNKGLIFTNHHCGYSAIQSHSSVENDYLKNGFWAMNQEEELPNKGLKASILKRMNDVTERVLSGLDNDTPESERRKKIDEKIKALIAEAEKDTHYKASIKPFFYGNQYFMFITETFLDVRLVGAPPSSIGKYGFDTDNWVWPRHTGDFAVFRIYANKENLPAEYAEDNVPYKPAHSLPISIKPLKVNDFTMVYGYPGRTEQYLHSAAVDYTMNISNPAKIRMRDKSLAIINSTMKESDALRIMYAAKQSRISNYHKKMQGENKGLMMLNALNKKRAFESEFNRIANSNDETQGEYGSLISDLENAYSELEDYALARDYFVEYVFYGPEVIRFSNGFTKLVKTYESAVVNGNLSEKKEEIEKEVERLKNSVKGFFKNYYKPTDKKIFQTLTNEYVKGVKKDLQPEYLGNVISKCKSIDGLASFIYKKSVFAEEEKIMTLLNNFGKSSVKKIKKDPAFSLMEALYDGYFEKIRPTYSKKNSQIDLLMRTYVKGQMEIISEKKYWADANSTLRVAFGKLEGSSPRDGLTYTPFTTLDGVMEKYIPDDDEYDLPKRLIELAQKRDYGKYAQNGELPVCFTASNHTTGGNSGSPVLNANGELIGINFDRSWESTMSDIMYDPKRCRNIAVDIRYVLFIIDKFARASHLIDEMNLVTISDDAVVYPQGPQ